MKPFGSSTLQNPLKLRAKISKNTILYENYNNCSETAASNGNSNVKSQSQGLPEFSGKGGGAGIFKLSVHAAVHPDRPPSLELWPHPLREKQIGRILRTILCTDDGSQLWAGSECGVRLWNLSDMYEAAQEEEETEDFEDAAPFLDSVRISPTLCSVEDDGNRLLWSGHKHGRIMCWKMDSETSSREKGACGKAALKEVLSWQAHRSPVLSMIMTSNGKV